MHCIIFSVLKGFTWSSKAWISKFLLSGQSWISEFYLVEFKLGLLCTSLALLSWSRWRHLPLQPLSFMPSLFWLGQVHRIRNRRRASRRERQVGRRRRRMTRNLLSWPQWVRRRPRYLYRESHLSSCRVTSHLISISWAQKNYHKLSDTCYDSQGTWTLFFSFSHLLHSDSYLSCLWLIVLTLAPPWLTPPYCTFTIYMARYPPVTLAWSYSNIPEF